jgi:hypothetical protein
MEVKMLASSRRCPLSMKPQTGLADPARGVSSHDATKNDAFRISFGRIVRAFLVFTKMRYEKCVTTARKSAWIISRVNGVR